MNSHSWVCIEHQLRASPRQREDGLFRGHSAFSLSLTLYEPSPATCACPVCSPNVLRGAPARAHRQVGTPSTARPVARAAGSRFRVSGHGLAGEGRQAR